MPTQGRAAIGRFAEEPSADYQPAYTLAEHPGSSLLTCPLSVSQLMISMLVRCDGDFSLEHTVSSVQLRGTDVVKGHLHGWMVSPGTLFPHPSRPGCLLVSLPSLPGSLFTGGLCPPHPRPGTWYVISSVGWWGGKTSRNQPLQASHCCEVVTKYELCGHLMSLMRCCFPLGKGKGLGNGQLILGPAATESAFNTLWRSHDQHIYCYFIRNFW